MKKHAALLAIASLFACVIVSCGGGGGGGGSDPLGMGGGTHPALINCSYLAQLQAWGGSPPYDWTIAAGLLPTGLALDTATGKITGTPTELGKWPFTVRVTDAAGAYVEKEFTIQVVEMTVTCGPVNPLSALIPTLSKDTTMLQIWLMTTSYLSEDAALTSITFTASGSGNDLTDVENVRLLMDNNNDGKLDDGDTQLDESQAYTMNNGTVTFDFNLPLSPSQISYLILVYDFTKNAWPEEDFQASIASESDIIASVTTAGPPLQGYMQRIRYPNWVLKTPTVRDTGGSTVMLLGRTDHDWAYDSHRGVFVMYGGMPVMLENETWEYNGTAQVWLRVGTAADRSDPPPCPRQNHAMCYIPGHVFMFGGRVTWSLRTEVLDESCRYVNGEWGNMGSWGGIMGYETANSHVWYPYHWEYYHREETSPPRREYHAIEYFGAAGVAVMYGGQKWLTSPPDLPDTWITEGDASLPSEIDINSVVWEYGRSIWTRLYATSAPGGRWSHAMVYESAEDKERIIMFGGYRVSASPPVLNDTWELTTGLVWNQLSPPHSPPARKEHDMMYDPEREVMILFGGSTLAGMLNDTWELAQTEREDLNPDWIEMDPEDSPSARDGHVMGWDIEREIPRSTYNTLYRIPDHVGRVEKGVGVLFGGWSYNDTWEYLR